MNLSEEMTCRACESTEDLQELFDGSMDFVLMLQIVADVSINFDDDLPKQICNDCVIQLQNAYDFRMQCKRTEIKLRSRRRLMCLEKIPANYEIAFKNEKYVVVKMDEEPVVDVIGADNYHLDDDIIEVVDDIIEETSLELDNELLDVIEFENIEVGDLGDETIKNEDANVESEKEYFEERIATDDDAVNEIESDRSKIEVHDIIETEETNSDEECQLETSSSNRSNEPKTDKRFKCETCSEVFQHFGDLNAHRKSHGNKRFQCPTCFKWFSMRYRLKGHQLIHQPSDLREFACDMCDKKYTNRGNLDRHVRHFHIQERSYPCQICGMCFARSSILRQHLAVHSTDRDYQCNLCDKKFKTAYYLGVHKRSHIPVEQRSKRRKPSKRPMKLCICQNCGKQSTTLSCHRNHMRTHTGEKPYECNVCHKRFGFQQALRTHQLQHTGEKPYSCDVCNMSFRQIGHLQGHKLIHSGIKKHKCSFCEKSFTLRGNLTVHMRLHTGEKPFQCMICNKKFYDSNGLKRHQLSHSRNSERIAMTPITNRQEEVATTVDGTKETNPVYFDQSNVIVDSLDIFLDHLGDDYTEIAMETTTA